MPSLALKLTDPRDGRDWWLRWSTIVDAPTSPALPKREFSAWLYQEAQKDCPWFASNSDWDAFLRDIALPRLLAQVEQHGTSYPALYRGPAAVIAGNRAGEGEACLTLPQLIDAYRTDE